MLTGCVSQLAVEPRTGAEANTTGGRGRGAVHGFAGDAGAVEIAPSGRGAMPSRSNTSTIPWPSNLLYRQAEGIVQFDDLVLAFVQLLQPIEGLKHESRVYAFRGLCCLLARNFQ